MDKNNTTQENQDVQEEGIKGGSTSMDQTEITEDTEDTDTNTYNLDYED